MNTGFVEFLARSVVEHPDHISVHSVEGEASLLFELRVHADDLAALTGEDRDVLRAMQQVVAASSRRRGGPRPVLDLIEVDGAGAEE